MTDNVKSLLHASTSRRGFMRGLGMAAASAGLLPVVMRQARADVRLTVFDWAGYEIRELHPEFNEKYGGNPNFTFFADEDSAFQKLRAGFQADVSHPCTLDLRRYLDAGLIKPIDAGRIPRWGDMFDSLVDVKGVTTDGRHYMMPWEWGNSSILYRTDKVEPKEMSYELFLDKRYKGRMSINDSVDEAFVIGSALAGYPSHMGLTEKQIHKSADMLRKVAENVRFYWTTATQINQAMATGEVLIAWTWTDTLAALQGQGVPVVFMNPEEGMATWVCGYVLNTDAPGSEEQAYYFLNALLDPQVGKYVIEQYHYGFSNKKAYDLVGEKTLSNLGYGDVETFLQNGRFEGIIEPEKRQLMIKLWEQIKAGY